MELYLGAMIRQVDSSLLDEWEKRRNPDHRPSEAAEVRPPGAEEADQDVTRDTQAFTAALRNRLFTFLRAFATGNGEAALAQLEKPQEGDEPAWTPERLKQSLKDYESDHKLLRLDPEARNARHTYIVPAADRKSWRVQQMLVDPEGDNDWVAEFEVDLVESRQRGEPVLRLNRIGSLT